MNCSRWAGHRIAVVGVILAAIALVGAGCGSDNETPDASTTATSTSPGETSTTGTSTTEVSGDGDTKTFTCKPRTAKPFPSRVEFAPTTKARGFDVDVKTPKVEFSADVTFDRATSAESVTAPPRPQIARASDLQFVFVRLLIRNTGKRSFRVGQVGGQFVLRTAKGSVYLPPGGCPAGALYAVKNNLAAPGAKVAPGERRRAVVTFVAPKTGKLQLVSRRSRERQTFTVGS